MGTLVYLLHFLFHFLLTVFALVDFYYRTISCLPSRDVPASTSKLRFVGFLRGPTLESGPWLN